MQASGGIVPTELFERLWNIMQGSVPLESASGPHTQGSGSARKKRKTDKDQGNTLDGWLKSGPEKSAK